MTTEEQVKIIKEIEEDVAYFTSISFNHIADKFKRDLKLAQELLNLKNELKTKETVS
jgi:ribosomal protein L9